MLATSTSRIFLFPPASYSPGNYITYPNPHLCDSL